MPQARGARSRLEEARAFVADLLVRIAWFCDAGQARDTAGELYLKQRGESLY